MNIGIIGAGALGSNIARAFAKAGIPAVISNSRGPESLAGLVKELGPTIKAGTTEEAAKANIVVDATNPVEWIDPNSPDAKDPTNPLAAYGIKAIDLGGRHSSSVVSEIVRGA